jgi:hypothetical protein
MNTKFVLSFAMAVALAWSARAFAQTTMTGGQEIIEPVIINGLQVRTGMWLLHAQPPSQAAAYQQPPVIVYNQPTPAYVPAATVPINGYYSYPYSYYPFNYGYYPYSYRYYPYSYAFGPRFGWGYRAPLIVNRPVVIRPFARFGPRFGGFGRMRGGGFAFGHFHRR